jgi:hypothetical protein
MDSRSESLVVRLLQQRRFNVDDLARTKPTVIIDNVEHPEPATISELVADEVQGPSLHWPYRYPRCDAIAPWQLAPLLRPNLQTLLGVEPVGALVV